VVSRLRPRLENWCCTAPPLGKPWRRYSLDAPKARDAFLTDARRRVAVGLQEDARGESEHDGVVRGDPEHRPDPLESPTTLQGEVARGYVRTRMRAVPDQPGAADA